MNAICKKFSCLFFGILAIFSVFFAVSAFAADEINLSSVNIGNRPLFEVDSTVHSSGARLDIKSPFSKLPPNGYSQLNFQWKLLNKTPDKFSVNFKNYTFHSREYRKKVDFTSSDIDNTQVVIIGGAGLETEENFRIRGIINWGNDSLQIDSYNRWKRNQPISAISKLIHDDDDIFFKVLENAKLASSTVIKSASRSKSDRELPAVFIPESVANDWRVLAGFDVLVISALEWSALAKTQKNIYQQWVKSGGRLLLIKIDNSLVDFDSVEIAKDDNFSSIEDIFINNSQRAHGLGAIYFATSNNIKKLRFKNKELQGTSKSNRFLNGKSDLSNLKVPDDRIFKKRKLNVYFVLPVLIIYAALVGPINLFFFASTGRRHRLFITTPLISLITSGLLFFVVFLGEGTGSKGVRYTVMQLSQQNQTAANMQRTPFAHITQSQFTRSNMIISGAFAAPPDALIYKLPSNVRDDGEFIERDGTMQGSYFQPRLDSNLFLEQIHPSRARIQVSPGIKSDGSPATQPIVNSDIAQILPVVYYRDKNVKLWRAERVKPGIATKMTEVKNKQIFETWLIEARENASPKQFQDIDKFIKYSGHLPYAISFLPNSEDLPIATLSNTKWHRSSVFIYAPQ